MTPIAQALHDTLGLEVSRAPQVEQAVCRCKTCGQDFDGKIETYYYKKRAPRPNYPGSYIMVDDKKVFQSTECPACKRDRHLREVEEEARRKWEREFGWRVEYSNIPQVTRKTHRFETFQKVKGKTEACAEAIAYCMKQPADSHFIAFVGDAGRGKTHLALSIGWHFLEKTGEIVRYFQAQELLDELMAGFHARGNEVKEAAFDVVLKGLKLCGVLIIDDLGAEHASDWATSTLDTIIDFRYIRGLRTVITSNAPEEELPPRVASRIKSGIVCTMKGIDYRGRQGKNVGSS